jgi:hypothetical protein
MKIHMNGFHPTFKHSCKKCNIAFEMLKDLVYHKFIKCPMLDNPLAQRRSDYNIFLKKKEEDKEKHVEERNKFRQNLKVMKEDHDNKNLADKKMEKSETEEERKMRKDEEVEERNMMD